MIVAQLTDLHIRADSRLCHGVADSTSNLVTAVDQLNRMEPVPDLALLTGDLTDDGSTAAYRTLRECLERLRIPFFVIPGNHDDAVNFKRAFGDHPYLPALGGPLHYVIDEFPLRLIGLDTTVAGEVGGRICKARRQWLSDRLLEQPQQSTLIFMHHPPFQTGISGLDECAFSGAVELDALIATHGQVELLISGHVHRGMVKKFGRTVATTSPSLAYQFTCDLGDDVALTGVLEPSGYLLHVWSPESGLVSHTRFIDDYDGSFPLGP